MNTILIFATQAMLSLLSFGLIAGWVIYPRLRERSLRDALTPLLLFETLRTIGLIVLVPGLVDAALPAGFALPARFDIITNNQLGLAWLLPTYGIPAFTVAQVMVVALLLTRGRHRAAGDRERTVDVPARLTASIS